MLTQEQAQSFFHYCPETGVFTWKRRSPETFPNARQCAVWNTRFAGKKAGSIGYHGYLETSIHGKNVKLHKMAFLYMTGSIPKEVDHVNRDRTDCRWSNLREATRSQNLQNRKTKLGRSGFKGVFWVEERKKWKAAICVNGKSVYCGIFNSPLDAARSYDKAAMQHYADFSLTNAGMGLI